MSELSIGAVARASQAAQGNLDGRSNSAAGIKEATVADFVNLSSEAKKRMEELRNSETVAEAYLKHILDPKTQQAEESNTDQNLGSDDDARKRVGGAIKSLMVDISWLVEAMGAAPDEAAKVAAIITARASVDYVQATPPVPQVIVQARANDEVAALYLHDLSIELTKDKLTEASVRHVAVTQVNPGVASQLTDPNSPRVVNVAQQDSGVEGAKNIFNDNLTARLAAVPSQELQGLLFVRETSATADIRRVRIDALMPV